MNMKIEVDDLCGPEIAELLQAHLDLMKSQSAPESVNALDLERLRGPGITFWSARENEILVGCIALKRIDPDHAEIKSMHTAKSARGRGIANAMLVHLEAHARKKGFSRLSLETGRQEAFAAARAIYRKFGFKPCPPFGDYIDDPNNICMTKKL